MNYISFFLFSIIFCFSFFFSTKEPPTYSNNNIPYMTCCITPKERDGALFINLYLYFSLAMEHRSEDARVPSIEAGDTLKRIDDFPVRGHLGRRVKMLQLRKIFQRLFPVTFFNTEIDSMKIEI